jgi:hypothetical protein
VTLVRHHRQISVECSERNMTSFTGNFDSRTIRETQCGALPDIPECHAYNVSVLNRQVLMIQQHIDRGSNLFGRAFVHCVQHPHRFGQH